MAKRKGRRTRITRGLVYALLGAELAGLTGLVLGKVVTALPKVVLASDPKLKRRYEALSSAETEAEFTRQRLVVILGSPEKFRGRPNETVKLTVEERGKIGRLIEDLIRKYDGVYNAWMKLGLPHKVPKEVYEHFLEREKALKKKAALLRNAGLEVRYVRFIEAGVERYGGPRAAPVKAGVGFAAGGFTFGLGYGLGKGRGRRKEGKKGKKREKRPGSRGRRHRG